MSASDRSDGAPPAAVERPRVILDCNALLQAFLSPDGPAAACLAMAESKQVLLVTSRDVLVEARGVFNRPFVRELLPEVTPERIDAFLDQVRYHSLFFRDVPRGPDYERDPKDRPYMDLAVAAEADFLLTRDKDLLSLATSHAVAAKDFRQRHQNRLRILTPSQFIDERKPSP
jgi:putative PIN family toxin of toxin-antitoxin system